MLYQAVYVCTVGNLYLSKDKTERAAAIDVLAQSILNNVMPEVGKLNIEPARQAIRELFIRRIVIAKGISKIQDRVSVCMPTPDAVLRGGVVYKQHYAVERYHCGVVVKIASCKFEPVAVKRIHPVVCAVLYDEYFERAPCNGVELAVAQGIYHIYGYVDV